MFTVGYILTSEFDSTFRKKIVEKYIYSFSYQTVLNKIYKKNNIKIYLFITVFNYDTENS